MKKIVVIVASSFPITIPRKRTLSKSEDNRKIPEQARLLPIKRLKAGFIFPKDIKRILTVIGSELNIKAVVLF